MRGALVRSKKDGTWSGIEDCRWSHPSHLNTATPPFAVRRCIVQVFSLLCICDACPTISFLSETVGHSLFFIFFTCTWSLSHLRCKKEDAKNGACVYNLRTLLHQRCVHLLHTQLCMHYDALVTSPMLHVQRCIACPAVVLSHLLFYIEDVQPQVHCVPPFH